jgi:thiosulfate/3-mercaptopyruvate sulfurtransferase
VAPLVTTDWLREHIATGDVVVVDCRWSLTEPGAGRSAYEAGHIPGATHLDVDADLSAPPGDGRHPLPSVDAFAAACARAGIGAHAPVVAYDEGNAGAARLWWLLRHFGHPLPLVLAGGFDAWDGPLARGVEAPPAPAEPFVPRARSDDVISAEELLGRLGDASLDLVDARAPERYRGEREPIDPVAGHIPGARNVPFAQPVEALADALRSGDGELVAYCGSGVSAATLLLAAEVARRPARLYPGSWSQWCARGLPAERADGGPS